MGNDSDLIAFLKAHTQGHDDLRAKARVLDLFIRSGWRTVEDIPDGRELQRNLGWPSLHWLHNALLAYGRDRAAVAEQPAGEDNEIARLAAVTELFRPMSRAEASRALAYLTARFGGRP